MKLRPIKTAPKDGTEIIIARVGKKEIKYIGFGAYEVEKYHDGKIIRGWYDCITRDTIYKVTHWMPCKLKSSGK